MTPRDSRHIVAFEGSATSSERFQITGTDGLTVWITGLSGSGKSTIAHAVEARLLHESKLAYVLDGDNLRTGINADLGFSAADRAENVRRVGEIARLMNHAGLVVLAPVISPFARDRAAVRKAHDRAGLAFVEVYIDTPLADCEQRDPKGLYARARAGEIAEFTGIDSPYETPDAPDFTVVTSSSTAEQSAESLLAFVRSIAGE